LAKLFLESHLLLLDVCEMLILADVDKIRTFQFCCYSLRLIADETQPHFIMPPPIYSWPEA